MTEYALATNLYGYAQIKRGFIGWPASSGEGDTIQDLSPGDTIVPKFAAAGTWEEGDGSVEWQRRYVTEIGHSFEEIAAEYDERIAGGERGAPFLLVVAGTAYERAAHDRKPWTCIDVSVEELPHPLSSREFLMLRAVPPEIAAQFKGFVSPGRHLQRLPEGAAEAVWHAGTSLSRDDVLRRYSLVEASTTSTALTLLKETGRTPKPGDRAFVASPAAILGVHDVSPDGQLIPVASPIPRTPDELLELFADAHRKARKEDQFTPARAIAAAKELKGLLEGPQTVIPIDDFGRFHDRYVLLANKITQALEISARPATSPDVPSADPPDDPEAEEDAEVDELGVLHGLTVEAVRRELPPDLVLPDSVLAEAVTALRAGKHLLLGGPPGTGKSTLAEALCRAVVGAQYEVATATADWTTFDTIGGYMPRTDGTLAFEPGIVLRCLQRGRWLMIDELNRADIDKAFGPLFTLLSGSSNDQQPRSTVLPYQAAQGRNVEIRWAERRTGSPGDYVLTPGWRLIGTLNLSDKAALFQLSFAFLRRFAVLDVPLPPADDYRAFLTKICAELPDEHRDLIVDAAIRLAFGPRRLGPAILRDVAGFLTKGLAETSSGAATYTDPVEAFVTAVRLFAVPQYEGSTDSETSAVLTVMRDVWPTRPDEDWTALSDALDAVALR